VVSSQTVLTDIVFLVHVCTHFYTYMCFFACDFCVHVYIHCVARKGSPFSCFQPCYSSASIDNFLNVELRDFATDCVDISSSHYVCNKREGYFCAHFELFSRHRVHGDDYMLFAHSGMTESVQTLRR